MCIAVLQQGLGTGHSGRIGLSACGCDQLPPSVDSALTATGGQPMPEKQSEPARAVRDGQAKKPTNAHRPPPAASVHAGGRPSRSTSTCLRPPSHPARKWLGEEPSAPPSNPAAAARPATASLG